MQPAGRGGGGGGGGLQRFRSAPATWLEALLEDVESDDVVLNDTTPTLLSTSSKPSTQPQPQPQLQPPPPTAADADLGQLDSVGGGNGGLSGFLRQSSSPAEFLSHLNSDDYFSNIGIPGNYDYLMPSSLPLPTSQSGSKRPRDADSEASAAKLSSPLKGEPSAQLHGGMGGPFDAGLEKLSEDSVLCRARAKRGFATHPRSIAERVRRTRISDRIRKLQELVPNMDKGTSSTYNQVLGCKLTQTNTADMLEEAVEYVKTLQRQIQELTEHQKRCTCSSKE